MIRYTLKCDQDHQFESWFKSAEAVEKLLSAGMVSCTVCGSEQVVKSVMAPQVRPARRALSTRTRQEAEIAEMRKQVQENSEYVGKDFATEARKIHDGDAPERSIYGEAKLTDAKALIEDGVPVTPLPFMPDRKPN